VAKLIRCPSGHVYDSEAQASCPECARVASADADNGAALEADSGDGGKTGRPTSPFLIWGCAAVGLIAGIFFLLRPSPQAPVLSEDEQKANLAAEACATSSGADGQACDRAIASGKLAGVALTKLYLIRGFRRVTQKDTDGAFADFSEASKNSPDSSLALAGLGAIHVQRNDCDQGLELLNRSIEVDPNIIFAYVNRAVCLSKTGNLEGARGDYQKALSLNPDPATKKAVEGVLEAMASAEHQATPGSAPSSADPQQQSAP
jgi:tetratricopeptide (TPR) repeat protein